MQKSEQENNYVILLNTQAQPNTVDIANISDPILVGLAHTSHSAGNIGESVFASVSLSGETAVSPKEKAALTWGALKAY